MHKESFRILKEISSLYQKKLSLLGQIAQEDDRTAKIQAMQEERKIESQSLEKALAENEILLQTKSKDHDSLQEKLIQNQSHINNVFTEQEIKALESQINDGICKVNSLESDILGLMEENENLVTKISEALTFIQGSTETINEIKLEIEQINAPAIKDAAIIDKRMDMLLTELPSEQQTLIQNLLAKQLKYGAFTRIEDNACFICRMELAKSEIQQVEKLLKFKQCASCSRIFIPISANYAL